MPPAGHTLLALWRRFSPLPGGSAFVSFMIGRMVPYSGSVRPRVLLLEPGHVRLAIRDRRGVRNHLQSVHAIALANIAELASGLAMTTALPPGVRGIVVRLEIEYVKKARGTLTAESRCTVPAVTSDTAFVVAASVVDTSGDAVANVRVTWRLSPARAPS